MSIYPDCVPCTLKQVLEISRILTSDEKLHDKIMDEAVRVASNYNNFTYTSEFTRELHNIVKRHTGISDPYQEIKNKSIKTAEGIYSFLKKFLDKKDDNRLYWALKISATGNIIDYAASSSIDIEKCVEGEIEKEFKIDDTDIFAERLKKTKNILIIGDNAGETVFDRILTEELQHLNITYAARSEPTINDATVEDAYNSGLGQYCKIISTGCSLPGIKFDEASQEFMDIFNNADIVISKGQGNFQTMYEVVRREIFFMLKAKCYVSAKQAGVALNDYVFTQQFANNSKCK